MFAMFITVLFIITKKLETIQMSFNWKRDFKKQMNSKLALRILKEPAQEHGPPQMLCWVTGSRQDMVNKRKAMSYGYSTTSHY